jgi:hypothetical protein
MTTYTIPAPDGKMYSVEGPANASKDEVIAEVLRQNPQAGKAPVAEPKPPKNDTAYDRFINAIEIPKMEGSRFTGPAAVAGAGELIKGAGALTELAFPETGENISRLGEKLTGEVKKQYPVAGTTGQFGSYAIPYTAAQKTIGAVKSIPQVASQVSNLGKIPSFALATGEQAAIGGATGYGLTPSSENRNQAALYGTLFGGATPAVSGTLNKLGSLLRGKPASPIMTENVRAGQEAGYVVPPTQVKPSVLNRMLEGVAGKLTTAQNASFANQEVTNKLAARALGLPEGEVLTPELLNSIRTKAGQAYENLRLSGRINPDLTFTKQLDDIVKDFRMAENDFKRAAPRPEVDLIESLKTRSFDANSAVSKIVELRKDANKAYGRDDFSMGDTYKKAAGALEDAIEKHLAKIGDADKLQKFRDARQLIAKTYTVGDALNPATGTINAQKLGSALKNNEPLTGELKDIAKFNLAFPKATQTTEKMGSLPQISPLDVLPASIVGGASYFTGHESEAGPLGVASLALRPAFRAAALSKPVQKNLLSNEPNLSPEVRKLIKMLTMESAIEKGANKPTEESK